MNQTRRRYTIIGGGFIGGCLGTIIDGGCIGSTVGRGCMGTIIGGGFTGTIIGGGILARRRRGQDRVVSCGCFLNVM